jgi:DNA-binding MarR family transcriptional regulator
MPDTDTHALSPSRALEHLHRIVHRRWATMATGIGVSHSEFEYLRAIKEQERRKVLRDEHTQHLQDVAAAMGVRKASASAMVVKLEERGLVRRVPCLMDARAQHILLTGSGAELLARGEAVYEAALAEIFSDLQEADIQPLRSAMRTLADLP